ncbi:hypothetical protein, partial [Bradyrhizobium japonicum]|uniref:hypothetical protein n=1 Tax=Bradyrhizobium japonicum TaxID=375 RepID=UPI001AEC2D53
ERPTWLLRNRRMPPVQGRSVTEISDLLEQSAMCDVRLQHVTLRAIQVFCSSSRKTFLVSSIKSMSLNSATLLVSLPQASSRMY